MNRVGRQLKHLFEKLNDSVPDPRKPGETWGDYYDARDAAEGQASFPEIKESTDSSKWKCTDPGCGCQLLR